MLTAGSGSGADGGGIVIVQNETLEARAKRLKRVLIGSVDAPYAVARELQGIASQWEQYKAEAGGLSFTAWCSRVFGPGRNGAYWRDRWEALLVFGEAIRRNVDHNVARWMLRRKLPAEVAKRCCNALTAARMNDPSKQPLSVDQARRILTPIMGKGAVRQCAACAKLRERIELLEGLLREHGIEVPE